MMKWHHPSGAGLPAGPPRSPFELAGPRRVYINNNINYFESFHRISREKGLTLACLVNPSW